METERSEVSTQERRWVRKRDTWKGDGWWLMTKGLKWPQRVIKSLVKMLEKRR